MNDFGDLEAAITEFLAALPGWWFTVEAHSVSRNASCGPDRSGPDAGLLAFRLFDEGFHFDDREPGSTLAGSLRVVMREALLARAVISLGWRDFGPELAAMTDAAKACA